MQYDSTCSFQNAIEQGFTCKRRRGRLKTSLKRRAALEKGSDSSSRLYRSSRIQAVPRQSMRDSRAGEHGYINCRNVAYHAAESGSAEMLWAIARGGGDELSEVTTCSESAALRASTGQKHPTMHGLCQAGEPGKAVSSSSSSSSSSGRSSMLLDHQQLLPAFCSSNSRL